PDGEREHLLDVVLHLVEAAVDGERLAAAVEDARARGLADVHVRLARLHLQPDHLGPERPGRHRVEVAALELLVARDAAVGHPPVQARYHLHPAGPVPGCERPLDTRLMDVGHAHEPPAAQRRHPAGAVAETQLADHRRGADLKLMPVAEQLDVGEPDRILTLDTQLEHQPVGQIDEILVEHRHATENRRLAVVNAVPVRARVVHAVGVLPLRRAARAQVAVARRGQRLPKPLPGRIETLVGEREAVHRAALRRPSSTHAKPSTPSARRPARMTISRGPSAERTPTRTALLGRPSATRASRTPDASRPVTSLPPKSATCGRPAPARSRTDCPFSIGTRRRTSSTLRPHRTGAPPPPRRPCRRAGAASLPGTPRQRKAAIGPLSPSRIRSPRLSLVSPAAAVRRAGPCHCPNAAGKRGLPDTRATQAQA